VTMLGTGLIGEFCTMALDPPIQVGRRAAAPL